MNDKLIKTVIMGSYEFNLVERIEPVKYPNHLFGVKTIKHTPKGKYRKFKLDEYIVYKTLEEATQKFQAKVNVFETNIQKRAAEKAEKKEKNALVKASDFYSLGDIIVNSWGFEQTNIEFYQIVNVGEKTIEIKEIAQSIVENSMYEHGMACNVTAEKDNFLEGGDTYKLRVYAEGRLSNPTSYYYMHKWSGKPEYKSWYA